MNLGVATPRYEVFPIVPILCLNHTGSIQYATVEQIRVTREIDIVYVIDPDEAVHDALAALLGATGTRVVCYPSAEAFLDSDLIHNGMRGLVLAEVDLPGMGSLALLRRLRDQALKAGAVEVIEKPLVHGRLLKRLHHLARHNGDVGVEPSG